MANAPKKQDWNWFGNRNDNRNPSSQAMTPWTGSFPSLSQMQRDMEDVFGNSFRSFWGPLATMSGLQKIPGTFQPNINIASNDREYIVTVEAPGIEEKDIRLDISSDGMLSVSGEKRQENQDKDKNYVECSYGSFQRTLSLPEDVDQEAIEAQFKNRVLTITCPRSESSRSSRRQIPIGSGRDISDARSGENRPGGMTASKKSA